MASRLDSTRSRIGALVAVAVALFVTGPAAAQLAKGVTAPLAEPEVSAGLLGVELEGYSPTYRMSWRECIEPSGKTKYHTPAGVQNGRLRVTPGGMACFAYEDTGYKTESCFNVRRSGDQYVFDGALGFDRDTTGDVFVTTKLRRGVKTCPSSNDLIS